MLKQCGELATSSSFALRRQCLQICCMEPNTRLCLRECGNDSVATGFQIYADPTIRTTRAIAHHLFASAALTGLQRMANLVDCTVLIRCRALSGRCAIG